MLVQRGTADSFFNLLLTQHLWQLNDSPSLNPGNSRVRGAADAVPAPKGSWAAGPRCQRTGPHGRGSSLGIATGVPGHLGRIPRRLWARQESVTIGITLLWADLCPQSDLAAQTPLRAACPQGGHPGCGLPRPSHVPEGLCAVRASSPTDRGTGGEHRVRVTMAPPRQHRVSPQAT